MKTKKVDETSNKCQICGDDVDSVFDSLQDLCHSCRSDFESD